MDTLEAATGIDFRNYVTHYEADTQGQLFFIILIELMQARLMIAPDVRYSRLYVYDIETQDLLYDTGKITIESAYEQMKKG